MAPTTMRMTPTVENRKPCPWKVTAQYMIAPAAIATVLKPIPVKPISGASHLVVWSVTSTFRGFAGCVVGTQADDVLNTTLRPTDEIDDRNDYQDHDECSKTDVHSSQLSWVARCATH